jgi:hypothetical protein
METTLKNLNCFLLRNDGREKRVSLPEVAAENSPFPLTGTFQKFTKKPRGPQDFNKICIIKLICYKLSKINI